MQNALNTRRMSTSTIARRSVVALFNLTTLTICPKSEVLAHDNLWPHAPICVTGSDLDTCTVSSTTCGTRTPTMCSTGRCRSRSSGRASNLWQGDVDNLLHGAVLKQHQQRSAQQYVLLHDVSPEAETRPTQTGVSIFVTVEVSGSRKDTATCRTPLNNS